MSDEVKRPWYRLHPLTVVVGVLIVASLVHLNIATDWLWFINLSHGELGWPIQWSGAPLPPTPAPVVHHFYLHWLLVDVAFAIGLLAGSLFTLQRFQHRLPPLRFSISTLLAMTACVATVLAIQRTVPWDWFLYDCALIVAFIAIGLTWLTIFDVLGIVFRKRSQSRKEYPDMTEEPKKRPPQFSLAVLALAMAMVAVGLVMNFAADELWKLSVGFDTVFYLRGWLYFLGMSFVSAAPAVVVGYGFGQWKGAVIGGIVTALFIYCIFFGGKLIY